MLLFFLFLLAFAKDETYDRYMMASSDILNPISGVASILDAGHADMLAFGPYTATNITNFDAASKLFFLNQWSVDTTGCIPNQPFPGACLIFINGVPGAALVPYKSSNMSSIADYYNRNRDNNEKWGVKIFGNIVVMLSNITLSTPSGSQTSKPLDAILYLEQNWVKLGKYPYTGRNNRETVQSRSRFYTTFPVNSQGKQDQLAMFDVIDKDENVGYGTLSGTTNYINGNSGDVVQHNRLMQTWPEIGY